MTNLPRIAATVVLAISSSIPLAAQDTTSVRAINDIPRQAVEDLLAAGPSLTERDINRLVRSPLSGDTVVVIAVLLSDPRNSGVAPVVDGWVTRVHFFVRDVAAAAEGTRGMGIQVIDQRWEENDVLSLRVGDVVGITGVVSEFQNGLFLDPLIIDHLGRFDDVGLDASILLPDSTVLVEDLNRSLGAGAFQANWEMYPMLNGSPVCLDRATVATSSTSLPSGLVDWAVTTDGDSRMYTYDLSHRFRNDTRNTYPAAFNVRDDEFVPPPTGALVRVCGFVSLQAFNDPDGVGVPAAIGTGVMFSLIPLEDDDLVVKEWPPVVESVTRPDRVLDSRAPYLVSTFIFADSARSVETAELVYVVDGDTTVKSMIERLGSRWIGIISPPGKDGAFVRYYVKGVDNAGAAATSDILQYRVLDEGIDSVSDIQKTHDGLPGESPFAGLRLPMNIRAVVASSPMRSGFVMVQDDSLLAPWSGIQLDPESVASLGLARGDRVGILEARIVEIDGMTQLMELRIGKLVDAPGVIPHKPMPTSAMTDPAFAEAYEGMLLRFESATIVAAPAAHSWSVTNAAVADSVTLVTESPSVSDESLDIWQRRDFVQGLWLQRGTGWLLVPESDEDLPEVINVAAANEEPGRLGSQLESSYPNPFTLSATVRLTMDRGGPATVQIFDLSGRLVRTLMRGELAEGRHEIALDGNGLPNGSYLIRFKTASGSDAIVAMRAR